MSTIEGFHCRQRSTATCVCVCVSYYLRGEKNQPPPHGRHEATETTGLLLDRDKTKTPVGSSSLKPHQQQAVFAHYDYGLVNVAGATSCYHSDVLYGLSIGGNGSETANHERSRAYIPSCS